LMASTAKEVVVVMKDQEVMGIIADSDIARLIAGDRDLGSLMIRDYMFACTLSGNQPCVQIRDDDVVLNALKVMENFGITQLLVVDADNRFVGPIDAIRAIKGWEEGVSRV
jgi:predicted transcriptional regulator